MTPEIGELMSALPLDGDKEASASEALAEVVSKLSHRPVPVGSLRRLWSLGGTQAKIALAYLAYWIRSGYSARDARERARNEAHLSAAIHLLGGMAYLRGAAMKIGQTLSNYPRIVPAEFATVLGQLHFSAPPMHFSLLREHVRNELGGDPEDVFESFETNAFAAASLGQVHRARLKTGEWVAVKIQYPNIARAIRDDFRSLSALVLPMRLTRDWDNMKEKFEDVRDTLIAETDYEHEAEHQEAARSAIGDDAGIVVPRVHRDLSTKRILTMDFLEGAHLDAYLATDPPQAERDRFGELMMTASVRMSCGCRLWYSDFHPGNFLFMPDGRLGLIDFGCCREFDDEEWRFMCDAVQTLRGDPDAYRAVVVRGMAYEDASEVDPRTLELAEAWSAWVNECMHCDGPFDFGRDDYVQRGIDLFGEIGRRRAFRSMPVNTWILRCFVGVRGLCYRLGARVDMNAIHEREGQAFLA